MTALYGPVGAAERARELRDAGASGVFTFEGPHDVFTPLTLAATVGGLDLLTNVAIAFPRNPIHLAHQAVDHQILTGGRFTLGLGTQVRTQIEKRFGAEFDRPVARMTELVAALRAIFDSWSTGSRLDFRGEFYRHTLMTPTFTPRDNPYGPPPIYVGALGPRLTKATAEHADGLLVMPFGNKKFLHEVTMAAVDEGLAAAGRTRADLAVVPEIIVSVDGDDDHAATRRLLAFYGSTPAYRPCSTSTAGASCSRSSMRCPSMAMGRDGSTDRRRRAAHHRRLRHPGRDCRAHPRPRRGHLRPDLHLSTRTDRNRIVGSDR
jgi:probable F420-dependent oxidoreductase